jgi:hypothetical protein
MVYYAWGLEIRSAENQSPFYITFKFFLSWAVKTEEVCPYTGSDLSGFSAHSIRLIGFLVIIINVFR